MDTKSGSSLAPFLEALNSRKAARAKDARETHRSLMDILVKVGPLPIEKLQHQSQMQFVAFADALKDLEKAALIRIDATSGEEIVSLAEKS